MDASIERGANGGVTLPAGTPARKSRRSRGKREAAEWSETDTALLLQTHELEDWSLEPKLFWSKVAAKLPGRTAQECSVYRVRIGRP